MCGIFGCIGEFSQTLCKAVMKSLHKRGPDGIYVHSEEKIFIGLARLAIVSPQDTLLPFFNELRQISCVVNGEIYNYQELRSDLTAVGHHFFTGIDTEVVLHAYEEYGLNFLGRLSGIFSLLIYDLRNDVLIAARDGLGVKPLYYKQTKKGIFFCSQVKPLAKIISPQSAISHKHLLSLLYRQSIPEPDTIFLDIQSLPAGAYAVVRESRMEVKRYFCLDNLYLEESEWKEKNIGIEKSCKKQDPELFVDLLLGVLKKQSDLDPNIVAIAQSDGVDSMLIGSLLPLAEKKGFYLPLNKEQKEYPAKNYLGFPVYCLDYNLHLSRAHNSWIEQSDQPPMDGFNTFLLCYLIKENIKVILSGIGADELFNGYPQFSKLIRIDSKEELIDRFLGMTKIFPEVWLHQIAINLGCSFNSIKDEIRHVIAKEVSPDIFGGDLLRELLIRYYLIPCLLRDADNNSMYNGIELRVPYLDLQMITYSMKFRYESFIWRGEHKFLLKQALNKILGSNYCKIKEGFSLNYRALLTPSDVIFPIDSDPSGYRNWCLKNIEAWYKYNGYESCNFHC